jgi:transcriptional regulator with XRE-family HTH domain
MDGAIEPDHHLRAWRLAKRLTLEQLAERMGMTHQNLGKIERGQVSLSKHASNAATALGIEPGDLYRSPQGLQRLEPITLPVCYIVAAGAWEPVDEVRDEPFEYYENAHPIPGYETVPQWLERVAGDSYNREIPEGFLVHVLDAIALEYQPRHGDTVIVRRARAQGSFIERSIKQVVLTPFGVELWPRSYNPKWDQPLKYDPDDGSDDVEVQIVGLVMRAYKDFPTRSQ